MRSFGSDNNSGAHPRMLAAIAEANVDHAIAYGDDDWTRRAENVIRKMLDRNNIDPVFVFNGTGANVVALSACLQPFQSAICAATAHIATDECGAPVKFTGSPLKEIPTPDGKLTPELVRTQLHGFGFEHHSQPKVIAISQTTEMGTVYTPEEVRALADLAHEYEIVFVCRWNSDGKCLRFAQCIAESDDRGLRGGYLYDLAAPKTDCYSAKRSCRCGKSWLETSNITASKPRNFIRKCVLYRLNLFLISKKEFGCKMPLIPMRQRRSWPTKCARFGK